MRIAHFCDSHPGRPDGVAHSAALTVSLLREAGHTVDFYHPGPLWTLQPSPGSVRSLTVPGRQLRISTPWPQCRPADVVHVHTTGPLGMAGFRLAARRQVPLIATWHTDLLAYADIYPEIPIGAAWCALQLRLGWSPKEYAELAHRGGVRQRRLALLGHGMFTRMAAAIAPSAKTADGFATFGNAGPEICILPTPLPPADPPPPPHKKPAARTVVLSVGRVTAEKNPELLLRAFALVHAAKPDARLIVLGAHQGRARLVRRVTALGLAGCVDVLPPVPQHEVAAFYRAADVLAFASTTDTQSLVITEAEAHGLPVVVADPGLARRPGDGPPRFTCAPTPPALAAALCRMLDDDGLRNAVIRDGLTATAGYPPSVYLRRLVDLYHRHAGHDHLSRFCP
ncbi:glycosyltransferase [Paractinoplanes maris]|uniref:glycosyltransferase n=1 Tax=Paractinoplanes maris TaxID=1734446 RepID=UPI0020203BC1|nr:glycosyltransferase [Actinoplanes maris]